MHLTVLTLYGLYLYYPHGKIAFAWILNLEISSVIEL